MHPPHLLSGISLTSFSSLLWAMSYSPSLTCIYIVLQFINYSQYSTGNMGIGLHFKMKCTC